MNALDHFNDISETGRDKFVWSSKNNQHGGFFDPLFLPGDANRCAYDIGLAAENAGRTLLHVYQLRPSFLMIKKRSACVSSPASSGAIEPNI
jgi:hypothetical protein